MTDRVLRLLCTTDGLASPTLQKELGRFGPELNIGEANASWLSADVDHEGDATEAGWFAKEGFALLPFAVPNGIAARLCESIAAFVAAGFPATFVYLFDEPWHLGEQMRTRIGSMLGGRYEILEDFWAWHVTPGTGRGWPPHRGITKPTLDRKAPELLNTWTAWSRVDADQACMHFVPLDEDPSYPAALDVLEAPLANVRAAPLRQGDALAWNANILHWGGVCSARAKEPRTSGSLSFARADAPQNAQWSSNGSALLSDLRARLDAVAKQIVTYGEGQPDVSEAVLSWAKATLLMRGAVNVLSRSTIPREF